jgi:hypothetical protein
MKKLDRFLNLINAIVFALASSSLNAATTIDNFSSVTNDRFQNSDNPDQFFLSTLDLSGVGRSSNGRWATLISSNTIISANHFQPTGSVFFYTSNDPNSSAIEISISGDSQRIGNTDLWLSRLNSFTPSSLNIYNYATATFTGAPGPPFVYDGESVITTGLSSTSFPAAQNQAYSTNIVSGFFSGTVSGLGDIDAIRMDYNPGQTAYESFLRSGDSGAPLFFNNNGELILLGINSYIETDAGGNPVASFSNYTGNESVAIAAVIAQYAAVPEPSTALLFSVAMVCLLCRRSRT